MDLETAASAAASAAFRRSRAEFVYSVVVSEAEVSFFDADMEEDMAEEDMEVVDMEVAGEATEVAGEATVDGGTAEVGVQDIQDGVPGILAGDPGLTGAHTTGRRTTGPDQLLLGEVQLSTPLRKLIGCSLHL